jgi:hypothetical protein
MLGVINIFYLDSNHEYTRMDKYTYSHYNKKTKMTVDLVFKPEGEGADVETRVKKILLRQYLKRELNTEFVSEDVLDELLSKEKNILQMENT